MSTKKAKYYAVWSGKQTGVFDSWAECERQVKGVESARYKSFPTREEAEEALLHSPFEYFSKAAKQIVQKADIAALPADKQPRYPALAVDGACSGNPGRMEYRGVDAATGSEIFHFGPASGGTNNIAEFLAIVHALALLKKEGQPNLIVYSDSRTALAWVRKRKCGSKLAMTEENKRLFDLIQRAENWLNVNTYTNPLLKWNTELWGEIPADFGRK